MTNTAEKIHLLNKKITLWQPLQGYKASTDSVFVAAACPVKSNETVLDMGCSAGNIIFPLLWRVPDAIATGIDIQKEYLDLAIENKNENTPHAELRFIHEDIRNFCIENAKERFDHIVTNPPYMEAGTHIVSPDKGRAMARGHHTDDNTQTLKEWLDTAHRNLKSGGTLTLIHRADMLDDILRRLGKRFGATEIFPVYSKIGRDAKRVIIRTIKDRKTPCSVREAILVHNEDGTYTEYADNILRGGAAIL